MIKQEQMRQQTKVSEIPSVLYKFNPYELSCLLYGGEQKYCEYSKAEKLWSMPPADYNLDREVGFRETLARGRKIKEIIRSQNLPKVDYMNNQAYGNMMNGVLPTNVSHSMFDALLQVLGSDEQVEMYLKPALDERIVGWYAQTEVGHGSDVQRLETEVRYDPQHETFTVNTPSVKAIKFWPGELGKMASHAIFHGRLLSNGKDHGVHAFICRIRDEKSHIPLKGLEIGDIGPKYGYGTKDNGYIIFNQFKVPKESLLSKYTTITKDGEVHTIGDPKIAYSVMLQIRSNLLKYGWEGIFKWLTVAGRYANFRSQFKTLPQSGNERKIITYEATKNVLIPFASLGYGIYFMWSFIKNNAADKIKDLHSLLSWLKAFFMNEVFDGIKSIREICGAHAYLISSNISNMMEIWSPNVTLEGDGFVLYQQTTKDILKRLSQVFKGKQPTGVYSYLNDILEFTQEPIKLKFDYSIESLITIIKASLLTQIVKTGELLQQKSDVSIDSKWNKLYLLDVVNTAKLNAIYITAKTFYEELNKAGLSDGLTNSLLRLWKVFWAKMVLRHCENVLYNGSLDANELFEIDQWTSQLVNEATPQLLYLVEPSISSDDALGSPLSSRSGDQYQQIYEAASWSQLNER